MAKNKSIKKEKIAKEKKVLFQSPKGMHDVFLPEDQYLWEKTKEAVKKIADFYGYSRIDAPILEFAEVFENSAGATSDIVEKQMFIFKTRGGDRLALRPEGTAGIMRAYFQHGLSSLPQPLKLFYFGPMFRHETPQAGRYRQFHQVGFEILGGENDPVYDAQIILTTVRLIEEVKIKNLTVQVNNVGCRHCRPAYRKKLQAYYRARQNKICKDCRRRLPINPLRLLDCKNEVCEEIKKEAPIMMDSFCGNCRNHFKGVLEYLDELGLFYVLNPYLVRGLDYYNGTVFEIFGDESKNALASGGRYDYLAEAMKARKSSLPAVGSGVGVERIIELMKSRGASRAAPATPKIFLIQMGEPAKKKAIRLIEEFRKAGIKIGESLGKDSLGNQLKIADRQNAEIALIFGQREVFEENIIIRDMKSGVQETVPLAKVVEEAKRRLNNH
ncbi:histidine--tRNA ligase [Candidatus Wolfebacteria bacterium]|nr:histidine--tRNA ligase [Candidatus Wolfebacteria bacterium]